MTNKKIRVLNLYCGIGGNRKLWPDDKIEVTAVEHNEKIAEIYGHFFPQDTLIIGDAHEYLRNHYKEFDFIWSSPPCPTHSQFMISLKNNANFVMPFPDMKLYEEIIFLKSWFKGLWVVENVISYYEPLIKPFKVQRHYFWSNFHIINNKDIPKDHIRSASITDLEKHHDYDLSGFKIDKSQVLANCVNPKLGLHIFDQAFKTKQILLSDLENGGKQNDIKLD